MIFVKYLTFLMFFLTSCHNNDSKRPPINASNIIENYSNVVYANYHDVSISLSQLSNSIHKLADQPTEKHLKQARKAWLDARKIYAQTEAFRFYGGPIDAIEGRLNAWPIDESYIDYVDGDDKSGIINDTKPLTAQRIIDMNEHQGESNISLGFHAIEFLLWGQDFYPESAGQRSYVDYLSHSNGKRRGEYLTMITDILVKDFEGLLFQWDATDLRNYRAELPLTDTTIQQFMMGLGTFIRAELAGERIQVAMDTVDQEDEQSCFSDSTHNDIYYNIIGLINVINGQYTNTSGQTTKGTSLMQLFSQNDQDTADQLALSLQKAKRLAKNITPPFDQAISFDHPERREHIQQLIDTLIDVSLNLSRLKNSVSIL